MILSNCPALVRGYYLEGRCNYYGNLQHEDAVSFIRRSSGMFSRSHLMENTTHNPEDYRLLGDVAWLAAAIPPPDTNLYRVTPDEAAFFKTQTGIDNDEDLKKHVLEVQAKAYKIAPYPCIHGFAFLQLNVSTYPVYEHVLKLGRERPNAILLDIGCCFGVDSRKAASDGFPAENIISSDINNEFLQLGHELFKTTPASYRGHLLPGDVFDPAFLYIAESPEDASSAPAVDLSSLKSLNPLHGRISVINAARLFHCFTEDKQLHLAKALAGLLTAQPGSIICGDHIAALEKGTMTSGVLGGKHQLFCHSPQTWTSLWDGEVFPKGSVKVETKLAYVIVTGESVPFITWSVTRL